MAIKTENREVTNEQKLDGTVFKLLFPRIYKLKHIKKSRKKSVELRLSFLHKWSVPKVNRFDLLTFAVKL